MLKRNVFILLGLALAFILVDNILHDGQLIIRIWDTIFFLLDIMFDIFIVLFDIFTVAFMFAFAIGFIVLSVLFIREIIKRS